MVRPIFDEAEISVAANHAFGNFLDFWILRDHQVEEQEWNGNFMRGRIVLRGRKLNFSSESGADRIKALHKRLGEKVGMTREQSRPRIPAKKWRDNLNN